MDYKKISQDVVDHVGGISNIKGATHCVTRLRLISKVLKVSYLIVGSWWSFLEQEQLTMSMMHLLN